MKHGKKNFIFYELNLTVLEEIMMWLSELKGRNLIYERL